MNYYAIELSHSQVSRKNSEGVLIDDYPMFHTAAALRSHMKNYLLETFKVNLADPITFPKWNDWWKAYKGEVLKPNGKMKVSSLYSILMRTSTLIASLYFVRMF